MSTNLYEGLFAHISKHDAATLVTLEVDGTLRMSHIDALQPDEDGALWFFTADHSPCLRNIAVAPEVCINFTEAERYESASLSGCAQVVRDQQLKREKWLALHDRNGALGAPPEVRNAVLVRVAVDYAEYWDPYGNNLAQIAPSSDARPTVSTGMMMHDARTGHDAAKPNHQANERLGQNAFTQYAPAARTSRSGLSMARTISDTALRAEPYAP